jgi:hypothetical protein
MAPEEKRLELVAASREAAAAFLEDLPHIRDIVAKNDPTRAEVRRLSAVLRRLLVERDIAKIADPRLGRVLLRAPDLSSAYRAERKMPFLFFASWPCKDPWRLGSNRLGMGRPTQESF